MTDKELIKQEIERRIAEGSSKNYISEGALTLESLLDFIDSLPEEPASEDLESQYKSNMRYQHAYTQDDLMKTKSEDLEEAAEQYAYEEWPSIGIPNTVIKLAYKAGAEWQKQKSMQDFLEKTEDAISMISRHYIGEDYTFDEIWEQFKNYMQNESEN